MGKHHTVPEYFDIYDDPANGICRDKNDIVVKVKPPFSLKQAKKISKRTHIYHNGRRNSPNFKFYYYNRETHCHSSITDLEAFIRERTKPSKRIYLTPQVVDEIKEYLLDPKRKFTEHLPPRDCRYILLRNGFYDIIQGSFHKLEHFYSFHSYQRFSLGIDYLSTTDTPNYLTALRARAIGQLVSGFKLPRCIIWCCDTVFCNMTGKILQGAFVDKNAVAFLPASASVPEVENAVDSDAHCIVIKLTGASEFDKVMWKNIKTIKESKKPCMVCAPFLPFKSEATGDEDVTSFKQSCLLIPSGNNDVGECPEPAELDLDIIVSVSLAQLSAVICGTAPDTCDTIERLFNQTDPNDVKSMMKRFFEECIIEAASKTDTITVEELTNRLKRFVEQAGGNPDKVKPKGIGVYLKGLNVKKDTVNGKVCIIGYKWKNQNEEADNNVN